MGREDDHPIRQIDGFIDVVRDEHHGLPVPLPDVEQKALHLEARLHVKRREGLIHQQDIGPQAQGPGDGGPLLHTAGEFMGMFLRKLAQTHLAEEVLGPLTPLFPCHTL